MADVEHLTPDDVDPAEWRAVRLRMRKADGHRLDVALLRPLEWLEEVFIDVDDGRPAEPGATVYLDLPELGAEGPAEIVAVEPCPAIGPPPSDDCRLVTGRFVHGSAEVLDLSVEGQAKPIGCTANHPFWSETRGAFVAAGELGEGETLRTADGELRRVVGIASRPGRHAVYNLEIDAEHVYYVSNAGVLVHNACQAGEEHHAIPWNNKKFNHQNNTLVKKSGVKLKDYSKNLRKLLGHGGRHLNEYHQAIQKRLNAAWKPGMSQAQAKSALDNVISSIWRDIRNGSLRPNNHDVSLP